MPITIRRAEAADAAKCGAILYSAFQKVADEHNFPPDFPSVEVATDVVSMLLANPGFYGIVAQDNDRVVGSNFADQRSSIAGIGPISIDPQVQNQGIGRKLMEAAIDHFASSHVAGIRLVQSGYNNRSLCLYTRLGFQAREPLSVIHGPPLNTKFVGYDVRPAGEADIEPCNLLCRRVHGFDRGAELREAIGAHTALVVEHLGRITGYATDLGFFAHAVAETNQDLKSLIAAAPEFQRPGFLLPTRNHEVFFLLCHYFFHYLFLYLQFFLSYFLFILRLLPRQRTKARHADDIDEHRVLQ